MHASKTTSIDETASWQQVQSLAPGRGLVELFVADETRSESFVVRAGDLRVDFSRQRIDSDILAALLAGARECDVRGALDRMLSGEAVNATERRAVGHMAVRMESGDTFEVSGTNVVPDVLATLERMAAFADAVRRGDVTGSTGRPFTTVVNIGIGGSDLGPRLVCESLQHPGRDRIRSRFVANVDPDDLASSIHDLDPEDTLFVVSSKTFTTTETLLNARLVSDWIRRRLGDAAVAQHIVAVSADERAVKASGLGPGAIFPLWDWVGGRFSVGSAVGLSAMITLGSEVFRDVLAGMRDLDRHIADAELSDNAPLLMAVIGIWNHAVLGYASRVIIPYSHALRRLPAYLQQLVMESNGKSIRTDGSPVGLETSAIIWGDEGTNAQHAFMQLLHQGTSVVPVDFIGFARSRSGPELSDDRTSLASNTESQKALFVNMVAQAQALAFGRETTKTSEPHRTFPGDRPSTVITAAELTPRILGQIIALYEHMVFYEGVLLGINSFDQWGVELGKEMASDLMMSNVRAANESTARAGRRLVEWFEANARRADD